MEHAPGESGDGALRVDFDRRLKLEFHGRRIISDAGLLAVERCALRPANVHSAHGWRDVLEPVKARYRHKTKCRHFRGDAAFANPEV